MKSVMKHNFGVTPSISAPRSFFDRSSGFKFACDADYLYPFFLDEIVPGDTMKMNATVFGRMNTPVYPIMDNLHVDTFWFYVPYRILFDNFRYMLGEQDNPGDSIDYTFPTMTSTATTGYADDSLHDFLGIPPGIPDFVHCSLPHRAYNQIFNHWFRNQNLQNSVTKDTGAGPDTPSNYTLLKRCKRHDYFTAALPWPQRGDTAITMPLGTSAEIHTTATNNQTIGIGANSGANDTTINVGATNALIPSSYTTPDAMMYADLSGATAATINAIRLSVATQQFLERDARGGTRANEIIRSHFGVIVPDYRAVYPEYLGGSTDRVDITAIPQTSQTATTPQGTMAGYGTLYSESYWSKSFTEYGLIMGIVNVRADLTYQQGVDKIWTRSTRYDLYWPDFAQLGEQAILQQEIELTSSSSTNESVWGYIPRYDDMRFKPSRLAGAFRSSHASSLDAWHLSEELSSPALDSTFIQSNTPMARVEAASAAADFTLDCWFDYKCVRPIPLNGVPGLTRF